MLLSIVSGGIWQSYNMINQSLNETRNRALANEELENFNRLVSQAASRAQKYSVEGRRDCIALEVQNAAGTVQFINFKIASADGNLANNAKKANAWMSVSPDARCNDDVGSNANWRQVTTGGQIDVSAPNRALRLDSDTQASRTAFSGLSGASI